MKTTHVFPTNPDRPDFSTVEAVSQRLIESSEALAQMTEAVATARQVKEYDSDLRKRALAKYVREFLVAGDSATAAETKGRASVGYGEELETLKSAYAEAEAVILRHDSARIAWETSRSLLSTLKSIANNI